MKTTQARIVNVALLLRDEREVGELSDFINEMLRQFVGDKSPESDTVLMDYCFNVDGNCPTLPAPINCRIPEDYSEQDFISKIRPDIQSVNL